MPEDEGGVIRLDGLATNLGKAGKPVGRELLEEPVGVVERELKAVGDLVADGTGHGRGSLGVRSE